MRIVGGEFSGRNIRSPSGQDVRPTTDRVREALFNILAHSNCPLENARVVDLFAGSGALGLEALSRGAAYALFVEENAAPRGAIRTNIETLELDHRTRLFRRDARKLGPLPSDLKPFNLAFLDPPYGCGMAEPALEALINGQWLEPSAWVVVEQRADETLETPIGIEETDQRTYGDTQLRFFVLSEN